MKRFLGVMIPSMLLMWGCAPKVYTTIYAKSSRTEFASENVITKGGVSISLKDLELNEYLKPEYSANVLVCWGSSMQTSSYTTTVNLFLKMATYEVEIVNNTDHILSLSDSRIVLILPEKSEPIYACDKNYMLTKRLPCYDFAESQIYKRYPKSENLMCREYTEKSLKLAIGAVVENKSFISPKSEVMPGMSIKGYIVFPYDKENIKDGMISFIDVKSNTNEAGQTILKTRFDFKVKQEVVYAKREYNQEQQSYLPYEVISEDEYNVSQQPKRQPVSK